MKKFFSLIFIIFLSTQLLFSEEIQNLTLRSALDQSLQSNLNLHVERFNPALAKLEIKKSWGIFDPILSLGLHYQNEEMPLTRQYSIAAGGLEATEDRNIFFSSGLTGKVPWGTEYKFDFTSTRNTSTFNQFNSEYPQNASATLVQPLLKDFGFGSNLAYIRISKNRYKASQLKLKQTMIDLITQVKFTYWDLVFAYQDLEVKKESLKLSQSLLEQNRARAKIGTLPGLEVVQSEAGVAVREETILTAEHEIKDKTNQLKSLLLKDISSHLEEKIFPQDSPSPLHQKTDPKEAIQTALTHRTDLEQAKIELANQNIFLKYYHNQSLPRIDLEGTLGLNGLAGSFGNSWEDLAEGNHPVWGAGLVFKYPLGNRTNKANYSQSKLQIKRSLLEIKRLENAIILQVDTTANKVETFWKRIQAATSSQKFAEEALQAEQKKYEAGTSTSHNVLEFEEDLAIAKSNKIRIEIEYLKALAEFEKVVGVALEKEDIHVIEE